MTFRSVPMTDGVDGAAGRETGVAARSVVAAGRAAGWGAAVAVGGVDAGFALDLGSIGSLIFDFWNILAQSSKIQAIPCTHNATVRIATFAAMLADHGVQIKHPW